jgi:hypothetical protein
MLNLLYNYAVHTNLRPDTLVRHTHRSYSLMSSFAHTCHTAVDKLDQAILQDLPS